MIVARTHDGFYSQELNLEVKELWIQIADMIESKGLQDGSSIADIGSAIGVFPDYLARRFPSYKIKAFEYLTDSVSAARRLFPSLDITQADITNSNDWSHQFDCITCVGVLSIFDDFKSPLMNIKSALAPGGHIFIHSLFNPYPVDVFVKYKNSSEESDLLESGWNIFSQDTFQSFLESIGFVDIDFTEFTIGRDLQKQDDPVRSWTQKVSSSDSLSKRQITNGLCLLQPHFILSAKLP